jgi:hypothetical protein
MIWDEIARSRNAEMEIVLRFSKLNIGKNLRPGHRSRRTLGSQQ